MKTTGSVVRSMGATLATLNETISAKDAEITELQGMIGEMSASIRYVGELPENPTDLDPEWYANFRAVSARGFVRDAS